MSKFERYKKKSDDYIYPHKHCKRCGEMIDEALTYCSKCYNLLMEKKKKKWYKLRKKKKANKNKEN
ncbi:MAG: hypothetical protein ACTSRH_00990 [Promethearchaeota archaeon]